MEPLTPVYTTKLFPPLHSELIRLLRGLSPADWVRPTVAGSWRVRDVVGHLLDIDLRNLSGGRDGYRPLARSATSFADIVGTINDDNATGVAYANRLSPRLLVDLLEVTGVWVSEYFASLPPHGTAAIPVRWAGEERSENWMHVGREYTERWHHQMQIRAAVDAYGLLERRWFYPLLDLSVRAFRRAYEAVDADIGTSVEFRVDLEGENVWSVVREASGWQVVRGEALTAAASVRADADTAWKLLYNALPVEKARTCLRIRGDRTLVEPILYARSVMV